MFKDFRVIYLGQSSPDELGILSISAALFDRFKNRDGQIVVGGGHNGDYYVVPPDDLTQQSLWPDENGISTLSELVKAVQKTMGWDSGGHIKLKFLQGVKRIATAEELQQVLNILIFPIQNYSGEQPGAAELQKRLVELAN